MARASFSSLWARTTPRRGGVSAAGTESLLKKAWNTGSGLITSCLSWWTERRSMRGNKCLHSYINTTFHVPTRSHTLWGTVWPTVSSRTNALPTHSRSRPGLPRLCIMVSWMEPRDRWLIQGTKSSSMGWKINASRKGMIPPPRFAENRWDQSSSS